MVDEPIYDVYRVWWDTANSRLYANYYLRYASAADITHQYGWMQNGKAWQWYVNEEAPRLIISADNETLLVQIRGKQTEFHFLKAGKPDETVTAELPLPWLMGEPAWDEHRIWVPANTGLYEIDRDTGRVTWLAHQDNTPFLSLLKHEGRLYAATSHGLYYREISPYKGKSADSSPGNK
jgi:ligand-binding sensor domain-containing protein